MDNKNIEEDSIDLLELVKALWKRVSWLIVAFAIGATVSILYTMNFTTPTYRASAMIYVYGKSTSVSTLADLQIGSQLTTDFRIIAKTREVINAATESIGLDMPYEDVVERVSITNPTDSRILQIHVVDTDPERACNLCNALANQLRIRIADVMNTDEPSLVQSAIVPTDPISPNMYRNALLGGFALFAIVAGIIVVMFIMDDTIKTEGDVEKYLKQNVIAVVPYVNMDGNRAKRNNKNTNRTKSTTKPATSST